MQYAAIPTLYKDVQFRSRLEARWAAYFDALNIEWQYEPLDLNGYIPDFWIKFRGANVLVEVKPQRSDGAKPIDVFSKMEHGIAGSTDAWALAMVGLDPSVTWVRNDEWELAPSCFGPAWDKWRKAGNAVQWKAPGIAPVDSQSADKIESVAAEVAPWLQVRGVFDNSATDTELVDLAHKYGWKGAVQRERSAGLVSVTAYRGDNEAWRIERLEKVRNILAAEQITAIIADLHDYKGTLYVNWSDLPTADQMSVVDASWCSRNECCILNYLNGEPFSTDSVGWNPFKNRMSNDSTESALFDFILDVKGLPDVKLSDNIEIFLKFRGIDLRYSADDKCIEWRDRKFTAFHRLTDVDISDLLMQAHSTQYKYFVDADSFQMWLGVLARRMKASVDA